MKFLDKHGLLISTAKELAFNMKVKIKVPIFGGSFHQNWIISMGLREGII